MIKAIVISENCEHCQHVKKHLKEKGLLEKVQLIDVGTEEGTKFADENDITHVPECVVMVKEGEKVRVCSDEEFDKLIEEGE